jgi:aspartate/tyrosine/aromatic aminotransferase
MFAGVEEVPPDQVFHVKDMYSKDTAELKLNLGIGAYRTDAGEPLVMDVVKKAEQAIVGKLCDASFNIEYLPIDGLPQFRAETLKLILGAESKAIAEGRVACCQSLSGTGALRMAAEFVACNLDATRTVFLCADIQRYRAQPLLPRLPCLAMMEVWGVNGAQL